MELGKVQPTCEYSEGVGSGLFFVSRQVFGPRAHLLSLRVKLVAHLPGDLDFCAVEGEDEQL